MESGRPGDSVTSKYEMYPDDQECPKCGFVYRQSEYHLCPKCRDKPAPSPATASKNETVSLISLYYQVSDELNRQNRIKRSNNHSIEHWWMLATEEIGEMAQAILQDRPLSAQEEIVHVMACLVRIHMQLSLGY